MAKKIVVYGVSGTREPQDVKKSVAQLLVRRLLADWVVENVSLRRRAIREFNFAQPIPVIPVRYVPEKMPPVEVPGVHFVPPPTWKSWPLPAYVQAL